MEVFEYLTSQERQASGRPAYVNLEADQEERGFPDATDTETDSDATHVRRRPQYVNIDVDSAFA